MSVSITSTKHRHQNKNSCKQNKNRTEKVEEIAKKIACSYRCSRIILILTEIKLYKMTDQKEMQVKI
jgi:hypothetical protein